KPVEADGAAQPVTGRGCKPRVAAAEAEADGEDRPAVQPLQVLHGGANVGLDQIRLRRLDVRHVLELVVTPSDAGGAPEIVDRDGGEAALRKPERELLVEAIEAADIREDDDAHRGRLLRNGPERGKPVP